MYIEVWKFRTSEDDYLVGEERGKRGVPDVIELLLKFPGTRDSGKCRVYDRSYALAEIANKYKV